MNERIRKLQESLNTFVLEARSIVDKAEAEKRNLNQEEQNRYNTIFNEEVVSLKQRIEREQALATEESRLQTPAPTVAARDGQPESRQPSSAGLHPIFGRAKKFLEDRGIVPEPENVAVTRRAAWARYLRGGAQQLSDAERRDLQMDADTQGGFLVAPQEFSAALIQAVDDQVWIRQFATIETVTNAEGLGIASLDSDPADPDWTAEIATGTTDTAMKFGKRELKPHPLAKRAKISNKLIRASRLAVEAKVIERLSYKFGIAVEKAYLLGTGVEQPLGIFIASTDGISTGRDVATGNSTTAIGADGVIEAKFKLKGNYWAKARWLYHRDALKGIMKLKDTNGQYLWVFSGIGQRGLQDGMPDTLLGLPTHLSEYVPNTFTTGKYVGVVGDISKYGIVDALTLQLQRLIELYAESNQVGYIGRLETDGMPLLEEAFARVTLA